MRMQACMALPAAPILARTGFRVVDLTGSSHFEVLIRRCRRTPGTCSTCWSRNAERANPQRHARECIGYLGVTPDSLMDAWMRQLNRHGCRSFWIYDVLYNFDKIYRLAKVAKEFGSEVAGAIMYTMSPVHSDEYFAVKAGKLAACPDIDTILLYDTAGVLEKERLQTLLPAIRQQACGKPLEFHSNNLLASRRRPISMPSSSASAFCIQRVDPWPTDPRYHRPKSWCTTWRCSGIPTRSIRRCCLRSPSTSRGSGAPPDSPLNQHAEYNVLSLQHQVPGGMMGTLKAQLAQHGMSARLEEVLRETATVRRELGYPGMATPFSQLRGYPVRSQHRHGGRYKIVPDEVIKYAAGYYGETVAPIDDEIRDRILAAPNAPDILRSPPEATDARGITSSVRYRRRRRVAAAGARPRSDLRRMRSSGRSKPTSSAVSRSSMKSHA